MGKDIRAIEPLHVGDRPPKRLLIEAGVRCIEGYLKTCNGEGNEHPLLAD